MKYSEGGRLNQRYQLSKPRLIALGLLAACLLLVLGLVVLPLRAIAVSYADSIEELEFRLAKFRKVAAGKQAWMARLEEIRQQGQREDRFFARDTTALASADLQTLIKRAVTDAGGELISTQVIPERKEEQFSRVAVKVRMTGSTPVLRTVLHAFESHTPVLFIENLNIRPIRVGQAFIPGGVPGAKPAPAKASDKLSVDFDVIGYMRGTS